MITQLLQQSCPTLLTFKVWHRMALTESRQNALLGKNWRWVLILFLKLRWVIVTQFILKILFICITADICFCWKFFQQWLTTLYVETIINPNNGLIQNTRAYEPRSCWDNRWILSGLPDGVVSIVLLTLSWWILNIFFSWITTFLWWDVLLWTFNL